MILMQTQAIFIDAYRELNAKKLFWITMLLSLLIVVVIASLGINENGYTFLWFDLDFLPGPMGDIDPGEYYISLFSTLGISLWLTWIATILALISTASIIPDLIAGGVIETTLSKPIARSRLFLTKYATGLLFVALQVGVFSVASFIVIGIRGDYWEPRLFLAIPIVLAFFSYLYAVSAFVGMMTKAAMPAILLTCLFWAFLFLLNMADGGLTVFKTQTELMMEQRMNRIEQIEHNTIRLIRSEMNREEAGSGEGYLPSEAEIEERNPFLPQIKRDLAENQAALKSLTLWYRIVYGVKTILPKTGETASLLRRYLIAPEFADETKMDSADPNVFIVNEDQLNQRVDEVYRSRPLWWVLGTSLVFEGILLAFCTWRFTRRDF